MITELLKTIRSAFFKRRPVSNQGDPIDLSGTILLGGLYWTKPRLANYKSAVDMCPPGFRFPNVDDAEMVARFFGSNKNGYRAMIKSFRLKSDRHSAIWTNSVHQTPTGRNICDVIFLNRNSKNIQYDAALKLPDSCEAYATFIADLPSKP